MVFLFVYCVRKWVGLYNGLFAQLFGLTYYQMRGAFLSETNNILPKSGKNGCVYNP